MQNFSDRPKRKNESVLMPHLSVILAMRNQKFSFREIKEYLENEHKIKVGSLQNLMKFYRRHNNAEHIANSNLSLQPAQQETLPKTNDINTLTNVIKSPIETCNSNPEVVNILRKIQTPDDMQGKKIVERREQK
jgi:intein-encoded DNA endonuclease-like protein